VGARPYHVANDKRAPTEGRPYKFGHYGERAFRPATDSKKRQAGPPLVCN